MCMYMEVSGRALRAPRRAAREGTTCLHGSMRMRGIDDGYVYIYIHVCDIHVWIYMDI